MEYDYYTIAAEDLDLNVHAVCHKCQNRQREGARTITEAIEQGRYER